MKPALRRFRVTARMLNGHVLDSELYLESILAAVHPVMHNQPQRLVRNQTVKPVVPPLPIAAVWQHDQRLVWAASAGFYNENTRLESTNFCKRRDGIDVLMTQRSFQPASGHMKDRLEKRPLIMAKEIHWDVATNNRRDLVHLLRRNVFAIGSLRRMGYGEVQSWDAVEIDDVVSACFVEDGRAKRKLPTDVLSTFRLPAEVMTVRPPYWYTAERCLGVNSGTPCCLKDDLRVAI